jgi:hypothetical protein
LAAMVKALQEKEIKWKKRLSSYFLQQLF